MDHFHMSAQPAEDDLGEAIPIPLDLAELEAELEAASWPQDFNAAGASIKTEHSHAAPDHNHLYGAPYIDPALSSHRILPSGRNFITPLPLNTHHVQPQPDVVQFSQQHQHIQQLSAFPGPVPLPVPRLSPYLPGQLGNMAIPLGHPETIPALDFNGYILYASGRNVPEELMRVPSGTSVAEPGSILDEENGRTYHNHHTGAYYYPNDAAEQDRLDLQHKIFKIFHDGGLHRAPVQCPKQVLDVACGTGIWAIQYALDHPEANVIGTDLSLIQPMNAPPNCSFMKEDSEKDPWIPGMFPALFDFVYLRLVNAAFNDHRAVMKKCFDNMEPGGWIEYNDASFELICTDGSIEGSSIQKWAQLMMESGNAAGRDFSAPNKYKQWLKEVGFVDIVEDIGPLPGNTWPSDPKYKEMGKWQMMNFYKGMRGMCWRLFRGYGMTPKEIESLVHSAREDLRDTRLHFSYPLFVVYARKPFPGEVKAAA